MATHQSAIKRSRQAERHRSRNIAAKSSIKTGVKSVLMAVKGKDPEAAKASLAEVIPQIAKAGAKGTLHRKNASRKISRLTKQVNTLKA